MDFLRYNSGTGSLENWLIEEQCFDSRYLGKCEAIFCQGNGYMGQRAALEEHYVGEKRNLFITGTFNKFDEDEVTELPNLPDLTNIDIFINGVRFSMDSGTLHSYHRTMNLKTGELIRRVNWESPEGHCIELTFKRFVSLENEHIIGCKVDIKGISDDMDLVIESGIDGQVTNSGSQHFHDGEKRIYDNKFLQMVSKTTQSKVYAALHCAHSFWMDGSAIEPKLLPVIDRRCMSIKADIPLKKGQTLTIEKLSSVHSSRDLKYEALLENETVTKLHEDSMAAIVDAYKRGYNVLFEGSKAAWKHFWDEHDVLVESSNPYDQLAIRFALYHLNIMIKKDDNRVGIGAKALSGEGYKGHSFWDTEIFILPYFMFTQPDAARTLLEYRYHNLYGAYNKAKENGFKGAMYPWESAWVDDGEVTPLLGAADVVTGKPTPILTGLLEQHITADVAYAVWQYFLATGDQEFLDKYGYEIIVETARFWASRLEWNSELSRYEINDVIGPDEYKEHVNNNAYTNYLAYYNMKLAMNLIEKLKNENSPIFQELENRLNLTQIYMEIEQVIDKLYLPGCREDGIIPQFDSFFDLKQIDLTPYKNVEEVCTIYNDYNMEQINGLQVCKQADLVMLLYMLDDLFDHEIKKKNYLYYEKCTLHDSSLSKSIHSVLANDLGYKEKAYEFFKAACDIDLGQNMKSSNMGIHSASMGGIWQDAVMGFGGVRIFGNQLRISPSLPMEWSRLDFSITWGGSPLKVYITQNQVEIENRSMNTIEMLVYDNAVTLTAGQTYRAETPSAK